MRYCLIVAIVIAAFACFQSSAAQDDLVDCFHHSLAEPHSYTLAQSCAEITDAGAVRMTRAFLDSTAFDEDGLTCAVFGVGVEIPGFYWVRSDGKAVSTPNWDNMCAGFVEDLAVGIIDRHQVYIDRQLEVALDPGFDLLGDFNRGYAKVCNGPFAIVDRGDPRRTGGRCGIINRSGDLVIDLLYPFESAPQEFKEFWDALSD